MQKKIFWFLIIMVFFLSSCVTVNIYFPASAVQKAADVIVEEIRGKEKKPEKEESDKKDKESRIIKDKKLSLSPPEAFAQIDIDISTPVIRALRESLKARFPLLKTYYEMGVIGENNRALLEIRDVSALTLKQKAEVNRLVDQENKDRNALYEEIIKANKMGKEMLPELQRIFANSWREKSLPNWWIQTDTGEWIKKK